MTTRTQQAQQDMAAAVESTRRHGRLERARSSAYERKVIQLLTVLVIITGIVGSVFIGEVIRVEYRLHQATQALRSAIEDAPQ